MDRDAPPTQQEYDVIFPVGVIHFPVHRMTAKEYSEWLAEFGIQAEWKEWERPDYDGPIHYRSA